MSHRLASPALALLSFGSLAAPPSAAQPTETAVYDVRFEATWSAATHPQSFPDVPHFSRLIGGVHDDRVSFWADGELASPGVEAMAERGRTSPLDAEVEAAIAAGSASAVVRGEGIPLSPGVATASFAARRDFSRLTLVSMVAPSPDWFVGVSALELFVGGDWLQEKTVLLAGWDAGSDDGRSYQSADAESTPHRPISRIARGPLGNGQPLGRFVITRRDRAEPDALSLLDGRFQVTVEWQDHALARGRGRAMPLSDESGYFWFFAPGNVELVVKLLDACAGGDRFWFFAGGLTDVGVELRVEDTLTGQVNVYRNRLGEPFLAIQDTDAFATCG